MFGPQLAARAVALIAGARSRGLTVATAESCTGGLVAALLTEAPGASAVVERGFVTYANLAKTQMLGVPDSMIAEHGAVSEAVARAMAEGALRASTADIAVSITGIAGPDGGSERKPIGLVHFVCARRGGATAAATRTFGDPGRGTVRMMAVEQALAMLEQAVEAASSTG